MGVVVTTRNGSFFWNASVRRWIEFEKALAAASPEGFEFPFEGWPTEEQRGGSPWIPSYKCEAVAERLEAIKPMLSDTDAADAGWFAEGFRRAAKEGLAVDLDGLS